MANPHEAGKGVEIVNLRHHDARFGLSPHDRLELLVPAIPFEFHDPARARLSVGVHNP